MKRIAKYLYREGKKGLLVTRVVVPPQLRPLLKKRELTAALGTADLAEGEKLHAIRLGGFLSQLEASREELRQQQAERLARASQPIKALTALSPAQVEALGKHFVQQSLLTDDQTRSHGLDDDEFDDLAAQFNAQREALKGILSRGRVEAILPALYSFAHLMGAELRLSAEDERKVALEFARSVARALDLRIARHDGQCVEASAPAQPIEQLKSELQASIAQASGEPAPGEATWKSVYENWRLHVANRPQSTCIAMTTAWRDLQRVATKHQVRSPQGVTPVIMRDWVLEMRARGLVADTVNDRLGKVRHVFDLAVGQLLVPSNPAKDTIGMGKSALDKRRDRRLPWSLDDLQTIFTSPIYDGQQLRSQGNAKEASYWIPLGMYYSGMRPEEFAGLAVNDIVEDGTGGYYFAVLDRPDDEDVELFRGYDDPPVAADVELVVPGGLPSRVLKNGASIRRVPVAQQLIDLGLLRYRDSVAARGHQALFPTLTKDTHGKLSGAFGKFFGRYKTELGFQTTLKTLYSFRHCMKDLLETARAPSKVLKRVLGHTSGDGTVTDGYQRASSIRVNAR